MLSCLRKASRCRVCSRVCAAKGNIHCPYMLLLRWETSDYSPPAVLESGVIVCHGQSFRVLFAFHALSCREELGFNSSSLTGSSRVGKCYILHYRNVGLRCTV